jgi:predicted membrane chloride channel (bestrophin family)
MRERLYDWIQRVSLGWFVCSCPGCFKSVSLVVVSSFPEIMIPFSSRISKYLTTPFPFPLVQMARTFLFFYVYTMPFALLSVVNKPIEDICLSFIVTYGFVGIEFVSIELDDPFGEDPNDLPVLGQARSVFDDVCLCILETDGLEYANKLQSKMNPASPQTHSSNGNRASESTALLV